jgi:hypothetical protein
VHLKLRYVEQGPKEIQNVALINFPSLALPSAGSRGLKYRYPVHSSQPAGVSSQLPQKVNSFNR